MDLVTAHSVLSKAGVKIAPGLTPDEFAGIQQMFGFRFPPDLKEFLSLGLPVSGSWHDWRATDHSSIRSALGWPLEGICFDIEHNAFWMEDWGDRPSDLSVAFAIARRAIADAPVLIPICSHRYIPALPSERGNPVFSVHQTDIIYYGANLLDYLQNEFLYYFDRDNHTITGTPRRIDFWTRLVELNV